MTANTFQNLPKHLNFKNNLISDTAQKKQTTTVRYNHKCFQSKQADAPHEEHYLSFKYQVPQYPKQDLGTQTAKAQKWMKSFCTFQRLPSTRNQTPSPPSLHKDSA